MLGPEMKSTGEVMGTGRSFGEAYAKAQAASGVTLPRSGTCFISVRERDKPGAVALARRLSARGFDLVATEADLGKPAGHDLEEGVYTRPVIVALAGFMMVLQPEFIAAFQGRLINIHPSLLPQFAGLDTHARAVESKVRFHGCSVHFVDVGVDTGPLIAQASLELSPEDDAHTAAARVLILEHALYPWVLSHLARGDIALSGSSVHYSDAVLHEATQRGFDVFPT
jgi:phosphoribosylglycinamide formyltransferase-1